MHIRRALVPVLAAIGLVALVAGCTNTPPTPGPVASSAAGGDIAALSGQEILTKSQEALARASSFQVKGTMTRNGEDLTIDLIVNGGDSKATALVGGQTLEAIEIGGTPYIKLPEMLLGIVAAADPGMAALAKDKYIKIAPNDPTLGSFADYTKLTDELLKADGSAGGPTKGETKTVNGTPAVAITVAEGTLWVATEGEPYPLRLEPTDGSGGLDFSNFNSAPKVEAPPAAEVFDATALTRN